MRNRQGNAGTCTCPSSSHGPAKHTHTRTRHQRFQRRRKKKWGRDRRHALHATVPAHPPCCSRILPHLHVVLHSNSGAGVAPDERRQQREHARDAAVDTVSTADTSRHVSRGARQAPAHVAAAAIPTRCVYHVNITNATQPNGDARSSTPCSAPRKKPHTACPRNAT